MRCSRSMRFGPFGPLLALLLALLLTLAAGPARAQCSIPGPATVVANYAATLARVARASCLGDSKADPHALVSRFDELVDEPIVLGQTERLLAAVDLLIGEATRGVAGAHEHDHWRAMLAELGATRTQIAAMKDLREPRAWLDAMEAAIPPKWKQPGGGVALPMALGGQPVRLLEPVAACSNEQPCAAFQSRLALVRIANLMARLQRYGEQNSLDQQYAAADLALGQWEAYRTKARHQYIWEVALNGARMGDELCPKNAGTGMRMGFCRVPTSQIILLHPEGALRFARSANKASELKPALLIEIIGRYQWEWAQVDGRDTAEMTRRFGYSLAATYSSTSTEKEWAFGPMLHWGDYTLAITKAGGGGRWSVVLNLALGERYFGRKQAVVDELAKVRKTDVLDLLLK